MKINYLLVLLAIVLGCKEGNNQESAVISADNNKQSTIASNDGLKQSKDYSSLFNSPDCKVITAEEISTALGKELVDMNQKSFCGFKYEMPDNKTWYLSIIRNDMSKSDIEKEIQSFKSESSNAFEMKMSDSGDTYLCNQHINGYLSMYNPDYAGSVLIRYGSIGESRKFSKEERLEHRALAYKLANTLLAKHQK